MYQSGAHCLNTRNRNAKGQAFFDQVNSTQRTKIGAMAMYDEDEDTFDVNMCIQPHADKADNAKRYFQNLYAKRQLHKDVQEVLVGVLSLVEEEMQDNVAHLGTCRDSPGGQHHEREWHVPQLFEHGLMLPYSKTNVVA